MAMLLEDDLKARGGVKVGPCRNLGEEMLAARRSDFDIAILDINLNGELVFPVADLLASTRKPFIFLSGYIVNLPNRFRGTEAISKPYHAFELERAISRALLRSLK